MTPTAAAACCTGEPAPHAWTWDPLLPAKARCPPLARPQAARGRWWWTRRGRRACGWRAWTPTRRASPARCCSSPTRCARAGLCAARLAWASAAAAARQARGGPGPGPNRTPLSAPTHKHGPPCRSTTASSAWWRCRRAAPCRALPPAPLPACRACLSLPGLCAHPHPWPFSRPSPASLLQVFVISLLLAIFAYKKEQSWHWVAVGLLVDFCLRFYVSPLRPLCLAAPAQLQGAPLPPSCSTHISLAQHLRRRRAPASPPWAL